MDWVGLIAGVSGVCCVVLVAKRKIINYLFGIVNVSLYAYISYRSQIWGDAFLNACYYFPMQFLGWWQWSRNRESSGREDTVKAKRMSFAGRLWLFAGCAVSCSKIFYFRPTTIQGCRHHGALHNCTVSYGAYLYGTVVLMDYHKCSKRCNVVYFVGKRLLRSAAYGGNVALLSGQLHKWSFGLE